MMTKTKCALIRENDGTPQGFPAPCYLNCTCGRKLPMIDRAGQTIRADGQGNVQCPYCLQKYDRQGWIVSASPVGQFARSIESGWLGKVIAIELHNDGPMLKMQGVNTLNQIIVGGDVESHLDLDDTQWFVPEDVKFVRLV